MSHLLRSCLRCNAIDKWLYLNYSIAWWCLPLPLLYKLKIFSIQWFATWLKTMSTFKTPSIAPGRCGCWSMCFCHPVITDKSLPILVTRVSLCRKNRAQVTPLPEVPYQVIFPEQFYHNSNLLLHRYIWHSDLSLLMLFYTNRRLESICLKSCCGCKIPGGDKSSTCSVLCLFRAFALWKL